MTNLGSVLKSRYYFVNKDPYIQSYGFSSSHVWLWELEHKEGWARKNWCFWTVVLEKTLESPMDWKEIKPVNPKGNQSWIFIGRTDAEAPVIWPPDAKSWLIGKDPDVGKDWRQGDKRGWAGWMASLTRWTWILASSRRWWRTRKPGVLQCMGLQRVGHGWATEQQQKAIGGNCEMYTGIAIISYNWMLIYNNLERINLKEKIWIGPKSLLPLYALHS